jgi:anti-sigma regulatory factor (Ser/Thr protein kinase)
VPEVQVDPAILERVIVNLTSNALRYSPPGKPPLLAASALGDRVELRVVDRGPGIPDSARDRIFVPFQRFGDTDNTTGVGLGLALSRGLAEVMGGTLEPDETPGGGLTMIVSLAAVPKAGHPVEAAPGRRERDETGTSAGVPVTRYGPGTATSLSSPGAGTAEDGQAMDGPEANPGDGRDTGAPVAEGGRRASGAG